MQGRLRWVVTALLVIAVLCSLPMVRDALTGLMRDLTRLDSLSGTGVLYDLDAALAVASIVLLAVGAVFAGRGRREATIAVTSLGLALNLLSTVLWVGLAVNSGGSLVTAASYVAFGVAAGSHNEIPFSMSNFLGNAVAIPLVLAALVLSLLAKTGPAPARVASSGHGAWDGPQPAQEQSGITAVVAALPAVPVPSVPPAPAASGASGAGRPVAAMPPPGWYPHPGGLQQSAYWDGADWQLDFPPG